MTAHDDDRLMVEAVEAGASGFLSKDLPADEILNATKAAAEGEVLIDPVTLTRLLAQVAREREEQRDAMALLGDLTDRERQILQLLAQGKRNDDIAAELYISPQTVQTHVRNILGKLRVHSKLEAVAFAVKHGAIQVTCSVTRHSGIQPLGPGVEACCATPRTTSGPANPLGGTRRLKARANPSLARAFIHVRAGRRAGPCRSRSSAGPSPIRTSRGALNRASVVAAMLAELLQRRRVRRDPAARPTRRRARPIRDPGGRPPPRRRPSGAARSTASTSSGHTVSAPVRIASSARPRTSQTPVAPTRPRSPVRSHPSAAKASAVAAGSDR